MNRSPVKFDGILSSDAVMVDPLTQRPITRQQQGQDRTTGGLMGILPKGRTEPTDTDRSRDRVNLESPDRR